MSRTDRAIRRRAVRLSKIQQPARETEVAARPSESNERREIVDMGTLQKIQERMGLLLGEEGQDHLALVAEKTDETVGLVGLVALEISVTHDHHLDRRVAASVLAFETANDSMSSVIWSSEGELSLIAAKPDKRHASTSTGTERRRMKTRRETSQELRKQAAWDNLGWGRTPVIVEPGTCGKVRGEPGSS